MAPKEDILFRLHFFKRSCEFFLYLKSFCKKSFNLVLSLFMNMSAKWNNARLNLHLLTRNWLFHRFSSSGSEIVGMTRKWKARESMSARSGNSGRWREKEYPQFPPILFSCSCFLNLDYLDYLFRLSRRLEQASFVDKFRLNRQSLNCKICQTEFIATFLL